MSRLTGQIAADVSFARPAEIPADLVLGYSGPAWPGVEQIRAWGKPFLLGFESATTRAYAGYDAGTTDALWHLGRCAEFGYPDSCGVWVCAADTPSTPDWALGPIADYFRAWRDVVGAQRLLMAYGNGRAVEAACAGGANGRWGVGTWGYGEGSYPNSPPGEANVDLLQSGNTPGPADGTDFNWLYDDLSAFAAWGGPAPTPPGPGPIVIPPQYLFPTIRRVSSPFGPREGGFHYGVDFSDGQPGHDIVAIADGTVVYNAYEDGGFGNTVTIHHDTGVRSGYGHLLEPSPVGVGARVRQGELIGHMGSTGASTGPHLHLWMGAPSGDGSFDPLPLLGEPVVVIGPKPPRAALLEEDSMLYVITEDSPAGAHKELHGGQVVRTDGLSIDLVNVTFNPFPDGSGGEAFRKLVGPVGQEHAAWQPATGGEVSNIWFDKDRSRNYLPKSP